MYSSSPDVRYGQITANRKVSAPQKLDRPCVTAYYLLISRGWTFSRSGHCLSVLLRAYFLQIAFERGAELPYDLCGDGKVTFF